MPIYTVSQVAQYLKGSLEGDSLLADLWITGETSNLRTPTSGHTYFTLKDRQSQLRAVLFKSGRVGHILLEGSLVTAHGRMSFYEVQGQVELIADLVMPEGTGPLIMELERLKMRLEEEGLFQVSRKRPLPRFPKVVGVVTSPSGEVLHDIRNVVGRRFPLAQVLLCPALVQGDKAAPSIVSALQALNNEATADVIILARGGGSLEELWPFNEEIVARAIYASRIPVVSAVGHERDVTISDYVADHRAPTPSAAAELVVPDRGVLSGEVNALGRGLTRAMSDELDERRQGTDDRGRRLSTLRPDVDTLRRRVDDLATLASTALSNQFFQRRERSNSFAIRLRALDPRATLQRGYAIVQKGPRDEMVVSKEQVTPGEDLKITVGDGGFSATAGGAGRAKRRPKQEPLRAGARLL